MLNLFKKKEQKPTLSPDRKQLKDVQRGQYIRIDGAGWSKEATMVVRCVYNDVEARKLLLEAEWENYKEVQMSKLDQFVLPYDSERLVDFHTLNAIQIEIEEEQDEAIEQATASLMKPTKLQVVLAMHDGMVELVKDVDFIPSKGLVVYDPIYCEIGNVVFKDGFYLATPTQFITPTDPENQLNYLQSIGFTIINS